MRRTLLTTSLITAAGLALTGASTCGPQGPAARDFAAGSLVIPMDDCYQRREPTTPSGTCSPACPSGSICVASVCWNPSQPFATCNTVGDDGVFRAYGLVYFLLKHNITVYWAIDNTKPAFTAPDLPVSAPASGAVAKKMSWTDGSFADLAGIGTSGINYIGGPFVIDSADAPAALALFQGGGDFAQFKSVANIEVHKVMSGFHAAQVRPLTGPPPKIAILNIAGPKTSADVMIKYAQKAGFDWACSGACTQPDQSDCECAGGISKLDANCTKAKILSTYGITVNNGPGKVYDILCDADFLPDYSTTPPDFSKATLLAKDGTASYRYKLLWAPHWETPRTTCPVGTVSPAGTTVVCGTTPDAAAPQTSASRKLADWLACIRTFVDAGNNLFAECHAIVALEGGYGLMDGTAPIKEFGLPVTRFQTTGGMNRGIQVAIPAANVTESVPTEPYMQIADFTFSAVNGNVSAFLPDSNGNAPFGLGPSQTQYGAITRFIAQNNATPNLDVMTAIKFGGEGSHGGSVVYMGGHDYSGQTAGTRIVLNTLFNLGFGCADPNTTCTTGLLGACAQGVMKCAGGGGLQCTGPQAGALDCKTAGADANCNGIPDQDEDGCHSSACDNGNGTTTKTGDSQPCPGGSNTGICKAGTRVCNLGVWGPCTGQQLPQPEVCNGVDDNCDGQVDEGKLCPDTYTCQTGICLPTACNSEGSRCPAGFQCLASGGACTGVPCAGAGGGACPAGKVCQANQCVDPCLNVKCGDGAGCSGGQCISGGCALTGCNGQVCVAGSCVTDPCAGNTCPVGTFCRVGPKVSGTYVADCVRSCSYVGCPDNQTCGEDGFCQTACSSACGTNKVCVNGTCADDPCVGVLCGAVQECRDGACVDAACAHVSCPSAGSTCSAGQCVGGDIKTWQATPIKPKASGGCGTGGGSDLSTLAFLALALALASRRRRLAPALAAAARRAAPVAIALLLALGTGCSKKGDPACTAPATACGGECADLQTSSLHCGACGHGCVSGFQCVAGGCSLPTGNPHLVSVAPDTIGIGASPKLVFTFDGLDAQHPASGLKVRLTGAVVAQELPLTVDGNTATLAAQTIQLDGESTGKIEARLVNGPSRLVSNSLDVAVGAAIVARTLSPALGQQDQTGTVSLVLQGLGFVQGATVTMAPTGGGTPQQLPPTEVTAVKLTATAPAPSTLKVGRYDVTVTNPDGTTSSPLAFTVTDGAPTITSISGSSGSCVVGGGPFTGTVLGTYLYPDTVAHVSGGTIVNSPLTTTCLTGTDALGKCQGGQVQVSADLSAVPLGTYNLKVVNPGDPPRESAEQIITVKAACP